MTAYALWLIGVGALLVVTAIILGAPQPGRGGFSFATPLDSTSGRMLFAAEAGGALSVAGGSILVAVDQCDWVVPLVVVGSNAAVIYALVAWKQVQFRRAHWSEVEREESGDPRMPAAWRKECARRCATTRWAILHPFEGDLWPRECYDEIPGAPDRTDWPPRLIERIASKIRRRGA